MRQLPSFSLPLLRLLGFSAASLPSRSSHISGVLRQSRSRSSVTTPERNHISAAFWLPRPVRLGFWGAIHDCSSTYIFFLVMIALGTRLLLGDCLFSGDPFVGLHCEHRLASTVVHDFEQRTMSTSVNGASDALGMGPSAGYILIYVITVLVFTIFICMSSLHAVAFVGDIHMHIYVIMNLLMLYF